MQKMPCLPPGKSPPMYDCSLCITDGGEVVFRSQQLRVVHCPEPDFPAFYRVVWNAHCAEFSDLSAAERSTCMEAVVCVEQALRTALGPSKINLASLGNMTPHLHWHVIARFDWDSHFPGAVWAERARPSDAARLASLARVCQALNADIARVLAALPPLFSTPFSTH
jgi:diadenosine tetraphosphate (Ap4A) HIT family hydrolase